MKKIFIFAALFIVLMIPNKVKAGFLDGDESLGGFSKLMEYQSIYDMPDEYRYLFDTYYRPAYTVTDKEYEILCRIVEAEATGGTVEQKKNVVSCVLARLDSGNWASTIEGVVFQRTGGTYQFTPIADGRYYSVKITDETKQAVDDVLQNGKTHLCEFFCSYASYRKETSWHRRKLTYGFEDGEHIYCY